MPRIALLSDIHANYPALEGVMGDLEKRSVDQCICLGDLVGYGAFPKQCIDRIIEMDIPTVLGNHDAGVAGLLTSRHFRDPNRSLIVKTREILDETQILWLKNLPTILEGSFDQNEDTWIAAHASPIHPKKWEYITSAFTARSVLGELDYQFVFIGHTHVPCLVSEEFGVTSLTKGKKFLINPGSIGQPRDGDFRASYCIIDTDSWTHNLIRVEYELEKTLKGLTDLGFTRQEAHHLFGY